VTIQKEESEGGVGRLWRQTKKTREDGLLLSFALYEDGDAYFAKKGTTEATTDGISVIAIYELSSEGSWRIMAKEELSPTSSSSSFSSGFLVLSIDGYVGDVCILDENGSLNDKTIDLKKELLSSPCSSYKINDSTNFFQKDSEARCRPPCRNFIDLNLLSHMTPDLYMDGFAEAIRIGVGSSAALFELLEHWDPLSFLGTKQNEEQSSSSSGGGKANQEAEAASSSARAHTTLTQSRVST
jgi:hypothetical protein